MQNEGDFLEETFLVVTYQEPDSSDFRYSSRRVRDLSLESYNCVLVNSCTIWWKSRWPYGSDRTFCEMLLSCACL